MSSEDVTIIQDRLRDLELKVAAMGVQLDVLCDDVRKATNGYIRLLKALIPLSGIIAAVLTQLFNTLVR